MSAPLKLSDLMHQAFHGKRVEPEPRMVGGKLGYAWHRFPIKGGISGYEVMARNISANNSLYRRIVGARKESK